jgi:4-amino-4-deoxy-L-arabinose transferase-like glycosyltransferase
MDQNSEINNRWLYAFIALAIIVNFSGIFVTIISPDGALYASIAKTMVWRNNYADLFVNGQDWLDKPHFPFWMAALSFKIFGITTWAYKLPAILFVMLGALYTYRFALELYNKRIALWAVLILLTSEHLIISNNDVRAEPYLTGLIIASVYYFYKGTGLSRASGQAQAKPWFWNILLGSLFAACAVMTKGIFAVIPIGAAIFGHLIIRKQWRLLFDVRWLIAIIAGSIFILPELWCLYRQFDLHPEKIVFGQTHVSGLKFFFWDSQFGRFFNDGPIKKSNGDPTFFLHTTLWAFLPWSVMLYIGIVQFFRAKLNPMAGKEKEWYCICAAGFTFLIFSLSKFQLPHYITIIFPFFAITTAQFFYSLNGKFERVIRGIQVFVMMVMIFIIGLLHYFFRPENISPMAFIALAGCVILFLILSFNYTGKSRIILQTCMVAFFVNLYFNLAYYPALLNYQSDSTAAIWVNKHNPQKLPLVQILNGTSYAMPFYANQLVYPSFLENKLPAKPYLLFGDKEALDELRQKGVEMTHLKTFERFRITMVNKTFLNRKTRHEAVKQSELVLLK